MYYLRGSNVTNMSDNSLKHILIQSECLRKFTNSISLLEVERYY